MTHLFINAMVGGYHVCDVTLRGDDASSHRLQADETFQHHPSHRLDC